MLLGRGWAKWIKSFKLSSLCELGLWRKIDVLLFDVTTKLEYKAISSTEYQYYNCGVFIIKIFFFCSKLEDFSSFLFVNLLYIGRL